MTLPVRRREAPPATISTGPADIKALHHRVEKDTDNFGWVFVHFRWK